MDTLTGPFAGRIATFEKIGLTKNVPGVVGRRKLPLRSALDFPADSPPWVWNCNAGRPNNAHVAPQKVPEDAPLLTGTYVYGGPIWDSFGHVMAEFVHRLWVTELPQYRDLPVAFTATEGLAPPRFLGAILDLLGVKEWTVLEGPARIERLVVGEQGKMLRVPSAPEYTAFLGRRVGPLANEPARFSPRLAVLRGHLDQNSGRSVGETWLAAQLEAQGYLVFRPEEHPLRDQVNAYLHAEEIIFSEGSAMHLFDIMPPVKARIVVLNRRPGSPLAEHTLREKCAELHVYDDIAFLGDPQEHLTRSLSLFDPSRFFAFLKEHGFVDRLPDSDLLDDASATAEDVMSFVKARHPARRIRVGGNRMRLLEETIAFLLRQTLRPPPLPTFQTASAIPPEELKARQAAREARLRERTRRLAAAAAGGPRPQRRAPANAKG